VVCILGVIGNEMACTNSCWRMKDWTQDRLWDDMICACAPMHTCGYVARCRMVLAWEMFIV
jgi:hypothetical protein